jgi:hypothetical protein
MFNMKVLTWVAVVLSVAAFALALWPSVGDAPWEKVVVEVVTSEGEVSPEDARFEKCLDLARPGKAGFYQAHEWLQAEGRRFGCWK